MWHDLPADVQRLAARELTTKQLHVFKLELNGCTPREAERLLGVSRWTIREHADVAMDKLARAGVSCGTAGWQIGLDR